MKASISIQLKIYRKYSIIYKRYHLYCKNAIRKILYDVKSIALSKYDFAKIKPMEELMGFFCNRLRNDHVLYIHYNIWCDYDSGISNRHVKRKNPTIVRLASQLNSVNKIWQIGVSVEFKQLMNKISCIGYLTKVH